MQRLFADLSDSARDSLRQSLAGGSSITKTETGSSSSVAAGSSSFAAQDGASEETVHSDVSPQSMNETIPLSISGQVSPQSSEQNPASLLSDLSSLWKTQDEDDHDSAAGVSTSSLPENNSIPLDPASRYTNIKSSEDIFPSDFISSLFSVLRHTTDNSEPEKEPSTDIILFPDLNALTTSLSSLTDHLSRKEASALSLDQIADALSSLPSQIASASTAAPINVSQVSHNSVDAPISIQVTAPSASPEEVGRSIYDVAERYLMRTLEAVF